MSTPAAPAHAFDLLILAAPAGEAGALSDVLARLPETLPATVVIGLSPEAGAACPRSIQVLHSGVVLKRHCLYLAPLGQLLEVRAGGRCVISAPHGDLSDERPLDQLLASVAVNFGARALVALLGGPGPDGGAGIRALRAVGGTVLELGSGPEREPGREPERELGSDPAQTIADLLSHPDATNTAPPPAPSDTRLTPRVSNALLHAILDSLPGHLQFFGAVRDEGGRIVDFEWRLTNRRWAEQWGDMTGKRLLSENPGVVPTGLFDRFVEVTQTGVSQEQEQHYAHEQFDGWFMQSLAKVDDGFLMTTLDITQARRASVALQESEQKYRHLFQALDEGFCLIEMVRDAQGHASDYRFLETNKAFEALTGLHYEAGQSVRERLPDLEDFWFGAFGEVARTGQAARFENVSLALGREYDVHAYRSGEPEQQQVAVLFRDITERRAQEAALRRSEEQFRLFVQASSSMVYRMSADWRQMYALDGKNILADTRSTSETWVEKYIPPGEQARVWAAIKQATDTGTMFELEHRVYQANGSVGWTLSRAIPVLGDQGEITEWFGAGEDITARKRAEANLAFLADVGQELAELTDIPQTLERVGAKIGEHFGVPLCAFAFLDRAADRSPPYVWRRAGGPELLGPGRSSSVSGSAPGYGSETGAGVEAAFGAAFGDMFEQLSQSGQPYVVRDLPPPDWVALGVRALVGVPIVRSGVWRCTLMLADAAPRDWQADEISLLREVAARLWSRVERALTKEALRVSEARYRSLFMSIDEAFAVVEVIRDAEGTPRDFLFLEVNPAFEKQTGMPYPVGQRATELLGTPNPRWAALYGQVALSGEPVRFEESEPTLERLFDLFVFRLGGEGSRQVGVLFQDITARKRAEEGQALMLRLEDTLRPLSDANQMQVEATRVLGEHFGVDRAFFVEASSAEASLAEADLVEMDLAGTNLAAANLAGANLAGVDGATGVARINCGWARGAEASLAGELPPENFGWPAGWAAGLLRRGECLVAEDTQSGGPVPQADRPACAAAGIIAGMAAPLLRAGQLVGALCVTQTRPRRWRPDEAALLRDVAERLWTATERTRAEAAVRASENRFRAVAHLVPDLLWESQPGGFTTWYNERWFQYTGQTPEQALGWGWTAAIHPDDRLASAHHYQQGVPTGEAVHMEHRVRRHDGEYRWFVVNTFALRDENGQVVQVYGAASDIHHLRTLNAELEKRVQERTHRLLELNAELAARTYALESLSRLTHDLAPHTDRYALIRRAQELLLELLPPAHTAYFELEDGLWRLRSEAGDLKSAAPRGRPGADLPFGSPGLFTPYTTRQPHYLDAPPEQNAPAEKDVLAEWDVPAEQTMLAELPDRIFPTAGLPILIGEKVAGVLSVELFCSQPWQAADRAVLETVAQHLGLALERAAAVQALDEEREALAVFAQFTERAAQTQEVTALAEHATEVLQQVLRVDSAVYFEREDGLWKGRHVAGAPSPELWQRLRTGLPASTPSLAVPSERREVMFWENWDAVADGLPGYEIYRAVARYPLFPTDQPPGVLGMARRDLPGWTEREKAVFRAVGDGFRLALERAARLQQLERQRERVSDLNAELGTLIQRTAHNLEAPAQRLSELPELSTADIPTALQDELARLRGVTHDLRQLSQIEEHELSRELLPLSELFAQVQSGRGAAAEWLIHPLPIVRADRALLRQALDVLLTFTLSQTRGARFVDVSSRDVEGEVWVTVTDDGVGLEPEEAATLFDLAVRTDQVVPLLPGGGLVQVRRTLARHGGWAWAEARISGGKVVLAFPRDEEVLALETFLREGPSGP